MKIDRELLWKVLIPYVCPERLIDLLRLIHDGAEGIVAVPGRDSERFNITQGTEHSCILASTLFTLFLIVVLLKKRIDIETWVRLTIKSDRNFFNFARPWATTKTWKKLVNEMLLVDIMVIIPHDKDHITRMFIVFTKEAKRWVMQNNTQKTEVLYQSAAQGRHSENPARSIGDRCYKFWSI